MKARIIYTPYGGGEPSISETTYEVVKKEKDNNILIVGSNKGKPLTSTYKDNEVLILKDK